MKKTLHDKIVKAIHANCSSRMEELEEKHKKEISTVRALLEEEINCLKDLLLGGELKDD